MRLLRQRTEWPISAPGVHQRSISSYCDAGIAAPLLNLGWDSYATSELDLQIGKSVCDLVTELKNRKNKQTKKSNKTHRGISRHGNLESAKTLDYTRMYCRHIHLLIHPWKQKPSQMNWLPKWFPCYIFKTKVINVLQTKRCICGSLLL
jgi:hypothetical protein